MTSTADGTDWAEVIARRMIQRVTEERERRRSRAERCRATAHRIAERLGREAGVKRVVLFGSLAGEGGVVHERSDVDLAVEGLSAERLDALAPDLLDAERVWVDLVRLEDTTPSLRERIESEGEALFVAE